MESCHNQFRLVLNSIVSHAQSGKIQSEEKYHRKINYLLDTGRRGGPAMQKFSHVLNRSQIENNSERRSDNWLFRMVLLICYPP